MSEIERAIKWAELLIKDTNEFLPDCSPALKKELIEQKHFAECALMAMREKAARENGDT